MVRSNLWRASLFSFLLLAACANARGGGSEGLKVAVNSYHDNLRWKRLNNASTYRLPAERANFLARYLAVEDDLSIDHIEVRGVTFLPDSEPPAADVVVTAEAYLLPSTVLEKHVITERWELHGENWQLVKASLEFAPELEGASEAPQESAGHDTP